MTYNEFYGIANRNYQILTPDAKLNLAKLDKAGLKNIVNFKWRLSARQWVSQLESDEYILSSILKNKGKLNEFFGRLTHDNQLNLRSALLQRSCESVQKFEEFLFLFNDLTSDEYDSIKGSATFANFRVSNKAAESSDEIISFLNSLPKNNRVGILFSKSFQEYNRSEYGIVDLILNKDFKTDDFDSVDFLEVVQLINSFRVEAANKSRLLNSLVNKFALTLIGSYEQTLMIAASPEAESLYVSNELFQMVIQQCTLKKQFVANSELDRPLAVDLQEDFEIKPADNSGTGELKFEPPSYDQLIVAAKELEPKSKYLAIQTYCQAMGLANQNIDPKILDRAFTLADSNQETRTYQRLIGLFELHFRQELENFHHLTLDSQVEKLSDISRCNSNYHSLCVKADGSRAFNLPIGIYENLVECTHRLKIAAFDPLASTDNLDTIRKAW